MSRTEQEAEFFDKIVKAYRANRRAPVQPTVIDPAKYDIRKASPETRAFIHVAHAMSGAAAIEKHQQRQIMVRLITSLRDQTQSKAEHDDCNKMLAVLS